MELVDDAWPKPDQLILDAFHRVELYIHNELHDPSVRHEIVAVETNTEGEYGRYVYTARYRLTVDSLDFWHIYRIRTAASSGIGGLELCVRADAHGLALDVKLNGIPFRGG